MDFMLIYQEGIYYVLWFLFLIIISFLIITFPEIWRRFRNISKKTWIILFLIFLFGLLIRLFIAPHMHLMYVDENLYMEMAKNMNLKGEASICKYINYQTEYCFFLNTKPNGWPFLISLIFLVFGLNNYIVLYLASIAGALSVLLIFMLTYLFFKKEEASLWAAFFYAFTPINIIWANTAETNSISVFFLLLSFILFVNYLIAKNYRSLLLFLTLYLFTILIRFENIIFFPLFILGTALFFDKNKKNYFSDFAKKNLLYISLAIMAGVLMLHWLFFPAYLSTIIRMDYYFLNIIEFLPLSSFYFIFLVLALFLIFTAKKENIYKKYFVFILFIVSFLLYLPFFRESRMALTPIIFLIILSGASVSKITLFFSKRAKQLVLFCIIALFCLAFWVSLDNEIKKIPEEYVLQTKAILEVSKIVPDNSYVVSYLSVLPGSVANFKNIDTNDFLKIENHTEYETQGNDVYFLYDMYCIPIPYLYEINIEKKCETILNSFEYTIIQEFEEKDTKFFLIKLKIDEE